MLRVVDLARAAAATTSDELAEAVKRALFTKGALAKAALRREVRACGGNAKSDAIDACVRKLIADGVIVKSKGARGSVLHTLSSGAVAARTVQHNGAMNGAPSGGPSCPSYPSWPS